MRDTRVTGKALPFSAHALVGETTRDPVNESINQMSQVVRNAWKETTFLRKGWWEWVQGTEASPGLVLELRPGGRKEPATCGSLGRAGQGRCQGQKKCSRRLHVVSKGGLVRAEVREELTRRHEVLAANMRFWRPT